MKCPFCDFYTRPDTNPSEKARYTESLLNEIALHESFGWDPASRITSVYFGGGTPSLTSPRDIERILQKFFATFDYDPTMEITLEINPEDVSLEKVSAWQGIGINRFSLGLEAMQDAQLRRLGRAGTLQDNLRALDCLKKTEVNLSVDLIFGLEHQTLENWLHTLQTLVAHRPQHISAYNLTIEEKTKYWVEKSQNKLTPPDDAVVSEMFLQGRKLLRDSGYAHYEISNYALPGFESKHNQSYWTGQNYWGVGVSAHSLQRTPETIRRFWNPKSIRTYMEKISHGQLAIEEEILAPEKHFSERIMTALRTGQGADLSHIEADLGLKTPPHLRTYFEEKASQGYLEKKSDRLAFTEKGLLFSDEFFMGLF